MVMLSDFISVSPVFPTGGLVCRQNFLFSLSLVRKFEKEKGQCCPLTNVRDCDNEETSFLEADPGIDELDPTAAESKASYQEIEDFIRAK